MLLKKSNLLTKKETFWKLLTCILDEEFVLSEHQGRTTPPPAKKAKQEIVNSSTVSPYWLEFVQYLIFRLVINSKVKKFVCMYFNCVTFFVWMPKLNFKSWTYYNIDKISQWEQSHYKSQFEFSYYCAFPRFLFGFDRKKPSEILEVSMNRTSKMTEPNVAFQSDLQSNFQLSFKRHLQNSFQKTSIWCSPFVIGILRNELSYFQWDQRIISSIKLSSNYAFWLL